MVGAQTISSTSGRLEEKVTHHAATKQREAATRRAIARARHGSVQQFGRWDSLFARVGLPMAELYADAGIGKAAGTTSFVPYSKFVRVLCSAEQRYGPAFTTDIAMCKTVADFDIVGYLFMNAPNLRTSLESARDCLHVLNSHCVLDIETTGQTVVSRYLTPGVLPDQTAIAAEIAALDLVSGIRRYLDQRDWSPTVTSFEHAPRENAVLLRNFLGGEIRFSQPFCGIQLPRALMRKSSPYADAKLFEILRRQRPERQANNGHPVDLVSAVAGLIEAGVRNRRLSAEEIADELALSKRTLYRRLKELGTSISDIRKATLLPIAKNMLSQDLPVSTIAYRLGYSDCRSFARAFKRATDMSPAEYRHYLATVSSTPVTWAGRPDEPGGRHQPKNGAMR